MSALIVELQTTQAVFLHFFIPTNYVWIFSQFNHLSLVLDFFLCVRDPKDKQEKQGAICVWADNLEAIIFETHAVIKTHVEYFQCAMLRKKEEEETNTLYCIVLDWWATEQLGLNSFH